MTNALTDELFASPVWAEVLQRAYGWTVERSAAGYPYVVLDDLAGRRVSALPFSDYLPVVDAITYGALSKELQEQFPDYRIILKTTLAENPAATGEIVKKAVYHRYFPGARADSSFRRGARKAEKTGLVIRRSTGLDALERFRELYHWQRLRKFGGIPQPGDFFRAVHAVFMATDRGFYLEAVVPDGSVAASLVVLRCGDAWFYKFGASDPGLLNYRPNNLLFAQLTAAVDTGEADFLDLGLSGSSDAYAGLRRFKTSLGGLSFQIRYLASGPELASSAVAFKKYVGGLASELAATEASPGVVDPLSRRIYPYFA